MYLSGGEFKINQIYGIIILSIISAIILFAALVCEIRAGNKLFGKESVLNDKNWYDDLKSKEDLWRKISDWEHDGHKIRCGCEGDDANEKEPCTCCCVTSIVSQILLYDGKLEEEEKYIILDAIHAKNNSPREMSNGGSCPCSNLAKSGNLTLTDKMHEIKFDIIMKAH